MTNKQLIQLLDLAEVAYFKKQDWAVEDLYKLIKRHYATMITAKNKEDE